MWLRKTLHCSRRWATLFDDKGGERERTERVRGGRGQLLSTTACPEYFLNDKNFDYSRTAPVSRRASSQGRRSPGCQFKEMLPAILGFVIVVLSFKNGHPFFVFCLHVPPWESQLSVTCFQSAELCFHCCCWVFWVSLFAAVCLGVKPKVNFWCWIEWRCRGCSSVKQSTQTKK